MKKRLLALIGVIVVLASALVIPVGAEDTYDSSLRLAPPAPLDSSIVGQEICSISTCTVSGKTVTGVARSVVFTNFVLRVYSTGYLAASGVYPDGTSSTRMITVNQYSVSFNHELNSGGTFAFVDILYNLSDLTVINQNVFDLVFDLGVDQEVLDQARQEGYQEGYQEGIQSADGYQEGVAAGRQEGYQEGYDAGVEAGRQEGYTEGVEVGRQEGYTQGVTDGLQQASDMYTALGVRPIWEFAQLQMIIDVDQVSGGTERFTLDDVPFTVSDDGTVSFERSIDYLASFLGVDVPLTDASIHQISFIWASDAGIGNLWDWLPQFPIYTSVSYYSYPVFTCGYERFTTVEYDDTRYGSPTFQIYNNRSAFVTDPTYPYDDIRKISFDLNVFTDSVSMLRTMTFTTDLKISADGYNAGYVAGYADGTAVVAGPLVDEAYDRGYGTGYVLGFSNGKKEGLQISETGDWKQLMLAVVEAPINTFQSLFNFEVLGLDMRAAFGSMMALCVLLIILKKVL